MDKVLNFNIRENLSSINEKYFMIYLICILSIGYYGKFRCENIKEHKDILEWNLFPNSGKYGLDGWSVSHFLFNMLVGYLYPDSLLVSTTLGGLWELFETYVGIYQPEIIKGFGFCPTDLNENKVWWYGKFSDLLVNFAGFVTGVMIYNLVNKKM